MRKVEKNPTPRDSSQTCVAILLAGGLGTRFSAATPKQLTTIAGKSILRHTLEHLSRSAHIKRIVVVANPSWHEEIRYEVTSTETNVPISIATGGKSRNASVLNAIVSLPEHDRMGKIIVHDSVRPIFSLGLITRVINGLDYADAVVPVVQSADPLFRIKGNKVSKIVSRNKVVRGQSPQGFRGTTLMSALTAVDSPKLDSLSTLYELVHLNNNSARIRTVEGEFENIKVTQPVDQAIAEQILKGRIGLTR